VDILEIILSKQSCATHVTTFLSILTFNTDGRVFLTNDNSLTYLSATLSSFEA
jgi:hypothetical protein